MNGNLLLINEAIEARQVWRNKETKNLGMRKAWLVGWIFFHILFNILHAYWNVGEKKGSHERGLPLRKLALPRV